MSKKKNGLYFLPLGGAAEIGMNLNLYAYNDEWLMVDFGVSFGDDMGVEVILPDPKFIAERKDKLKGLLLTHAHEDHIGAIPYLWPQLECPLYATPFTAHIIRGKLKDAGLLDQVTLHEIPLDGDAEIGPFKVQMVRLTHSIPEPNGVLLSTPAGRIFHTGDWKIDPDPLLGEPTDVEALKKIGDEGVLAMVCDSTNVFNKRGSGSEKDVYESLQQLLPKHPEERFIVSCFASNVARMQSIARVAVENGRKVVGAGRSIFRMEEAARACGYLAGVPKFLQPKEAKKLSKKETLVICTGSQGEARAALKRMSVGSHPDIKTQEGDVVVFSSRVIPGNEKRIGVLKNSLIRQGCLVVTQHHYDVHVSGHPSRDELEQMYEWVRPKIAIPVHGELRHLVEHGRLAKRCGIEEVVICDNGSLVQLTPDPVDIIQEVHNGRLVLDGDHIVAEDHQAIRERKKLGFNGLVIASFVFDEDVALLAPPHLTVKGIVCDQETLLHAHDDISDAFSLLAEEIESNEKKVRDALSRRIRYIFNQLTGKKPEVVLCFHEV